MAFPDGWGRKQKITIQSGQVSGSGSHTDFPALITLDHLDTEIVDAGSNSALSGGGDIRFSTDSAGTTQLACEVVEFTPHATPASRVCEIWVKVPSVSTSVNTDIYIWYKKTGETQPAVTDTYGRNAVWTGYASILHLGEDPSGTAPQMTDSTGGGNDATSAGSMTSGDVVAAQVGDGLQFDDTDDELTIADDVSLDLGSGDFVVSAWVSGSATSTTVAFCDGNAYWVGFSGSAGVFSVSIGLTGTSTTNDGSLHHVAFIRNGSTIRLVVNGVQEDSATNTTTFTNSNLVVGNFWTGSFYWDDKIDEYRIGQVGRSVDYIKTEYNNQKTPSTFATAGTPEATETSLTIAEASHSHTGDNIPLGVHLSVADSTHAHTADNLSLGTPTSLTIAEARSTHSGEFVNILDVYPEAWKRKQKFETNPMWVPGGSTHSHFVIKLVTENVSSEMADVLASSALNGGGDIYATTDALGTNRIPVHVTGSATDADSNSHSANFITSATPASRDVDIFVRLPSLSPSLPTSFYIWYGNTAATQPSSFADDTWKYYTTPTGDLLSAYNNNLNNPTDFITSYAPENEDSDTVLQNIQAGHDVSSDNITIGGVETSLTVADATHSHTADNLSVTTQLSLTVNEASHSHSADGLSFGSTHLLSMDYTLHIMMSDNIDIAGELELTTQEAVHSNTSDGVGIIQQHSLVLDDAEQELLSENVALTYTPGHWREQPTSTNNWTIQ